MKIYKVTTTYRTLYAFMINGNVYWFDRYKTANDFSPGYSHSVYYLETYGKLLTIIDIYKDKEDINKCLSILIDQLDPIYADL